ncbi:MAG: hypothetical protein KDH84_19230, partial [Calditrichaeota bacterium]|nr:hypothetical protein [Calditrichota bacterium]
VDECMGKLKLRLLTLASTHQPINAFTHSPIHPFTKNLSAGNFVFDIQVFVFYVYPNLNF